MALMQRARGLALAGATTLALALSLSPVGPAASASAAPAAAAVSTANAANVVTADDRSTTSSRSSRSFAARSSRVMSIGNSLKGTPYRYGGTTPRGFDCSGFTSYVFRKVGVSLPHSSSAQRSKARRISRSQARAGDLVFFHSGGGRVYHVGIYAGGGRILHSPRSGERVKTVGIWSSRVSFGRVL